VSTTDPPGLPRLRGFGEAAYQVELGGGIDAAVNARALAIAEAVRADKSGPWGPPVPAYDSVLVPFDPDRGSAAEAEAQLEALVAAVMAEPSAPSTGPAHRLVVDYGGLAGPDLEAVAEALGLTPAQVVEAHASETYQVFVLGFAPGFAYLGPLPEVLRLPRRAAPRPRIAAGSVAIAGAQTAVYPSSTPGGWHIIGRTDAVIWDAQRQPPALLLPGDTVRFEPRLR
jgi:KipI family sensor histidine kinase inhibitor